MKGILRTLALTGIIAAAGAAAAQAQVAIGVRFGEPVQAGYYNEYVPACPGEGFIWTPGYYAGRAWFPGRWVNHNEPIYAQRGFRYDHRDYHFDNRDSHFENRGWDHGRR
jgi:hypothetical protein